MSKQENTLRRAGLSAAKLALLEKRLARKAVQPERAESALRRLGQESAPLSFSQEHTAAAAEAEGQPSYYNIVVRFQGEIDIAALERTLSEVVRRHESLRTGFPVRDGRRVQVVAPPPTVSLAVRDISDLPEEEREERALQLAAEQVREPFDLAEPRLLRAGLLRLGEAHHLLLLAIAHIVCDSQSLEILTREMSVIYAVFSQGRPSPLPELPVQCADYASWQREHLRGERYETLLAYWRRQLDGCDPVLRLPTAGPRPPARTFRGAYSSALMPKTLAVKLERLSLDEGVTPFMTLLAAFKVLLHRLTGQDDIVVGSAAAGRQHRELEGLIGCFINLLAFRTRLSEDPTFRELLGRVGETAVGAYNHQEMPFGRLVEELRLPRDESYPALAQVIFAFSRTAGGAAASAAESAPSGVSSYMINPERSSVDLTLSMKDAPHGLLATFEYNTNLFEAAAIDEMLKDLQSILEAVAADPDLRLSSLARPARDE
ncbi:MAG: condensation domain-containing protein [Acidobacteria bacterium]|nr:condensation domain-containing protein [Acidobacteriota bacterium]